jgi:hypothetical protein
MYRFRNVLLQSPEKVKVAVLAVLGVVAGLRGWDPDLLETVGVGIAIERLLDLFYVAPVARANTEAETLKAIDLGQQLARRPLRSPGADHNPG